MGRSHFQGEFKYCLSTVLTVEETNMNRARFASRLGFILVSAGCAVGIGNVWKFPYMCGQFGGAMFILIYLVFLAVLGLPIMISEFAVGRGSQRSVAQSFKVLQPKGQKWHHLGAIGVAGCYLLMMFYTTVGGWMLYYCYKTAVGGFAGADTTVINQAYSDMLASPGTMLFWTIVVIVLCFTVCLAGVKNGVEKVTKWMMICLLALMGVLAIRVVTLPGAAEGVKFYLIPNFNVIKEVGLGNIVFGAMSQAFFTLSLGIGAMAIFGSYLDKERSITGEAVYICILDTMVALLAGFIVIPSCFAYNVPQDAGPSLIFKTLPNVFANMPGGRLWGALFFLFLSFAALTTIITVFENITTYAMEGFGWSRKKSVFINLIALTVLSVPCILGFNILSDIAPLGEGSNIMDLEDFIVSNNLLPLGSVVYLLFCIKKNGWGWDNFLLEVNAGEGLKFPRRARFYLTWILPLAVVVIYIKGYYDMFASKSPAVFATWAALAAVFLIWIASVVFYRKKQK